MRYTTLILSLLSLCLWTGCETENTFTQRPPEILSGDWMAGADSYVLQFLPNNRFAIQVPGDSPVSLTGWAYYPQKGHVTLVFDKRIGLCPEVTGVYAYERDGDELTFMLIQDSCKDRAGIMARTWKPEGDSWF